MGDKKKRNYSKTMKKNPFQEAKKRKLDQSASDQHVTDIDQPSTSANKLG